MATPQQHNKMTSESGGPHLDMEDTVRRDAPKTRRWCLQDRRIECFQSLAQEAQQHGTGDDEEEFVVIRIDDAGAAHTNKRMEIFGGPE